MGLHQILAGIAVAALVLAVPVVARADDGENCVNVQSLLKVDPARGQSKGDGGVMEAGICTLI